jgi:excisionase family DNA binding protein
MDRLLLRVEEGAATLGVSRAKIFALIARGEIKAVKIDGSTRIAADELRAFVERLPASAPQAVAV